MQNSSGYGHPPITGTPRSGSAAPLVRYNEPLNDTELEFLVSKERRERKQYFVIYRILLVAGLVLPFIASWYREYDDGPNAFSFLKFFVTTTILIGISTIAIWMSYKTYHRKMIKDIKEKTKTIETARITKKVFIPSKNACYFYTQSAVKMSIEVSQEYFHSLNEGDEVSIEYTTNAQLYLGYF
jgi:Na+/melibiose symporter-like transporter